MTPVASTEMSTSQPAWETRSGRSRTGGLDGVSARVSPTTTRAPVRRRPDGTARSLRPAGPPVGMGPSAKP
jgi:hypothetical protein